MSSSVLHQLIADGELTPTGLVSRDGKSWYRAVKLNGVKWLSSEAG